MLIFSHRKEFWHHRVVGDQGGEGRVVLQESLEQEQMFMIGFLSSFCVKCSHGISHLDFVARLVSDNNVVGDPLRMETLGHPTKKIYILPQWGPIPPKQFIKV